MNDLLCASTSLKFYNEVFTYPINISEYIYSIIQQIIYILHTAKQLNSYTLHIKQLKQVISLKHETKREKSLN